MGYIRNNIHFQQDISITYLPPNKHSSKKPPFVDHFPLSHQVTPHLLYIYPGYPLTINSISIKNPWTIHYITIKSPLNQHKLSIKSASNHYFTTKTMGFCTILGAPKILYLTAFVELEQLAQLEREPLAVLELTLSRRKSPPTPSEGMS